MSWLEALLENRRRGSYPRCLLLMNGERAAVARRITEIINVDGVVVSDADTWAPLGIPSRRDDGTWDCAAICEAKLGKTTGFLTTEQRDTLTRWWLKVIPGANLPNWDIVSTCTVSGKPGLLLIEAKAHDNELRNEEPGKSLDFGCSDNSFENHKRIGQAIADAAAELQRATRMPWAISRDNRYQMSNRFAWACKLAELGYAVVVVYLGFERAIEMRDRGVPLDDRKAWEQLVLAHSAPLFPGEIWRGQWAVHGHPIIPVIRSVEQPLVVEPT